MGPRAGLDGRKISLPTGIRSPGRPARSSVAVPTELPNIINIHNKIKVHLLVVNTFHDTINTRYM